MKKLIIIMLLMFMVGCGNGGGENTAPKIETTYGYGNVIIDKCLFYDYIDQTKDYTNIAVYIPLFCNGEYLPREDIIISREEIIYAHDNGIKLIISFVDFFNIDDPQKENQNIEKLKEIINGYEKTVYAILLSDEPSPQRISAQELNRRVDVIKNEFDIPTVINYAPFNEVPLGDEYFPNNLDILAIDSYGCLGEMDIVSSNVQKIKGVAGTRPVIFIGRSYWHENSKNGCEPSAELIRDTYETVSQENIDVFLWFFYGYYFKENETILYGTLAFPSAVEKQKEIGKKIKGN